MSYVITGLDPAPFRYLYGLSDAELAKAGAIRMTADAKPGFPCRVTLEDAEPGTAVLLLNHEHLPVDTPYRSCLPVDPGTSAGMTAKTGASHCQSRTSIAPSRASAASAVPRGRSWRGYRARRRRS